MSSVYVIVAVAATFGAVLTVSYALVATAGDKRKTLRYLESQISRRVDLREEDLHRSFVDRVLRPLLIRFGAAVVKVTPPGMAASMNKKLTRAGLSDSYPAGTVIALKFVAAGATALLIVLWVALSDSSSGALPLLTVALTAIAFFAPDALLSGRGERRQEEIRKRLPDTIDLLTISVEAGLGLDAAIARVIEHTPGPLSEELNRMLQEMRLGMPRIEALKALKERTDLAELDSLVLALIQADTFGVSIANVLRSQAGESRTKRRQRAEERAMKIPVKILFPLIFCVLPSLFVVVIGPGVIRIAESLIGAGS